MFSSTAVNEYKDLFKSVHPDANEDKTSRFSWENSGSGIKLWSCVNSTLRSDKLNGGSSTGRVVIAFNTPVVSKTNLQSSVKKSTYGIEFSACGKVIDVAMTSRDQVRCLDALSMKLLEYFVIINLWF